MKLHKAITGTETKTGFAGFGQVYVSWDRLYLLGGYDVYVITDACGDVSDEAHEEQYRE
jgi:nicotinamidase-related amidase